MDRRTDQPYMRRFVDVAGELLHYAGRRNHGTSSWSRPGRPRRGLTRHLRRVVKVSPRWRVRQIDVATRNHRRESGHSDE